VLLAASIPVLLHLLSRRKLPLIPFSSLKFLKMLQMKKARRIQLRQLILLVIRTLAVLALVFAFARPALQGSRNAGSAAAVEMVILFDDGLHSSIETRNGQMLRLSSQRLEDVLELVGADDRVSFIRLSNPQQVLTVSAGQLELIRDKVDNLEQNYQLADLHLGLQIADSILKETDKFNREIYLIAGFHSPSWDSISWQEPTETEDRFLLPVGPDRMPNLSVGQVRIENTILQAGQPVNILANISNRSERRIKDALISLYLGGERVAQTGVNIAAEASQFVKFSTVPRKSGKISGYIVCEDIDPFMADNRRWFVLDIPETLRIMAVASADGGYADIVRAGLSGTNTEHVEITWVGRRNWESKSFQGFDVILFLDLKNISAGAAQRVSEFVNHGGGVIFFQDIKADLATLSRDLWRKLGFAGAKGISKANSIGWGKFDLTHPIFAGVFEGKASPRSPVTTEYIEFATRKDDQVIIPFSNGKPFLMERRLGKGKVLMYSISLDPSGGNFIFSGIFAPILFRSISYAVSGSAENQPQWHTGVSHKIILPLVETDKLQMISPAKYSSQVIHRPVMGGSEIITGVTNQPGIYTLSADAKVLAKIACNIPDVKYDLERTDIHDLVDRLGAVAVIDQAQKDLKADVYANRFGRELWRPIVVIFLLLLLSESIIGRELRRQNT